MPPRPPPPLWRLLAATLLPAAAALLPATLHAADPSAGRSGDAPADPVVARRIGAFYAAHVGRPLGSDELRRLAQEFIRARARAGQPPEAIRRSAAAFFADTLILRDAPGSAAAMATRHLLVEMNYFNPELQGTLELQLMVQPDPVRVVDRTSRRLMTERDVVALANLHRFAAAQGVPQHAELPRPQIDQLARQLAAMFDGGGTAMPRWLADAATFWAGVRQQWPYLAREQQALVRAYAGRTWRVQLPVELYGRLWGLEPGAAQRRWSADVAARIRGRPDLGAAAAGQLRAALDAVRWPPS
jgi:hypothetical protein